MDGTSFGAIPLTCEVRMGWAGMGIMRFDGQSFRCSSFSESALGEIERDGECSHKTAEHEQQPPHTDDETVMMKRG